jgi:hypothetical protein
LGSGEHGELVSLQRVSGNNLKVGVIPFS